MPRIGSESSRSLTHRCQQAVNLPTGRIVRQACRRLSGRSAARSRERWSWRRATPATTCAARARCVSSARRGFEQLGVGEDDAELVVQAVEQNAESLERRRPRAEPRGSSGAQAPSIMPSFCSAWQSAVRLGLAPERVREDADRAAGGPDVLDLAAGDPVVDRAAADADQLARLEESRRSCGPASSWLFPGQLAALGHGSEPPSNTYRRPADRL